MCIRDSSWSHIASPRGGGSAPPDPLPRKAPPARPPARFVITVGFSAQKNTKPPGRGFVSWKFEAAPGSGALWAA
eukprot:2444053-Alexandrium_andersonii.AAC.1